MSAPSSRACATERNLDDAHYLRAARHLFDRMTSWMTPADVIVMKELFWRDVPLYDGDDIDRVLDRMLGQRQTPESSDYE
jgi:hypothetical protein